MVRGSQDHGDDPSPEEIRQACHELQSAWTEDEERQRRTGTIAIEPYQTPTVPTRIGGRNVTKETGPTP